MGTAWPGDDLMARTQDMLEAQRKENERLLSNIGSKGFQKDPSVYRTDRKEKEKIPERKREFFASGREKEIFERKNENSMNHSSGNKGIRQDCGRKRSCSPVAPRERRQRDQKEMKGDTKERSGWLSFS